MKTLGIKTFKSQSCKWRLQIYWPALTITKQEFFLDLGTVIRIQGQKDYFGFGFQVLNFGIGFDYASNP